MWPCSVLHGTCTLTTTCSLRAQQSTLNHMALVGKMCWHIAAIAAAVVVDGHAASSTHCCCLMLRSLPLCLLLHLVLLSLLHLMLH